MRHFPAQVCFGTYLGIDIQTEYSDGYKIKTTSLKHGGEYVSNIFWLQNSVQILIYIQI